MTNQIQRARPKFTLEFKRDAAKLVNEKGYTHQQAADSLGISLSAIGRWSRSERGSASNGAMGTKLASAGLAEHAELLRLRKENAQLRMEREILKKAAGDSTGHCNTAKIFSAGDIKFNVFLGR